MESFKDGTGARNVLTNNDWDISDTDFFFIVRVGEADGHAPLPYHRARWG